jgi:hypothetical protein
MHPNPTLKSNQLFVLRVDRRGYVRSVMYGEDRKDGEHRVERIW